MANYAEPAPVRTWDDDKKLIVDLKADLEALKRTINAIAEQLKYVSRTP